ncbi:MAG: hemolysin [SAR86 cluster bacterium]|uniref:L-ornithine N(alpha)-acyltransferase n=1 Tax=SAR86 cluster bacterium TaxID=2030880 RepID=A0A2A5ATY9_9GAMM|nr:MAG: hemolysin [SAR86 cluster bacterium]
MTNPCRLPFKPRIISSLLEKALGLSRLGDIYDARPENSTPHEFLQYTLDALGVSLELHGENNLDEIPRKGPLLIVANHPLGGLEGVAIAKVISEIRPDLQVLTNELLRRIPELRDIFIGVDVLSSNAAASNVGSIKQVHKHLKNDGAVLIFPAGMVSTYDSEQGRIQDRSWSRLVGQLLKRYQCTCLPVYVDGRNSSYFYAAGMLHPRLRTALLPRQLANKQGFNLPLIFGRPIPAPELRLLQNPKAITDYLRVSTDALARTPAAPSIVHHQGVDTFDPNISNAELMSTIDSLAEYRLIEHEQFDVYCAPFDSLGPVMEQIAIAREIAFRSVGEGTGLSQDSDQFDPHYLHLFLWDKAQFRIVGAYRVGLVDEIVAKHGVKGLYSRSLYEYDEAFIKQLGSAIEMGRSFIHPDYQRKPVALNLLWRGIGAILVKMPRYHTLFGSVSISRQYSDLARALIADTLLANFKAVEFERLVKPITPHKIRSRVWTDEMLIELANVKMLSKLIGRCDPGKGLPVLLRHYLSVSGRLVCFNIHPNFNDSLEGLIIVDARKTDAKTLTRFLGAEGYKHFNSFHQLRDSA